MSKPKVLVVANRAVRDSYLADADVARLKTFTELAFLEIEVAPGSPAFGANADPGAAERIAQAAGDTAALIVCHGSPLIDAAIMDRAPALRLIGELEGDRFAARIDVEEAWRRAIHTVDTTNGSSYPVSEWALALAMIGLRNAGAHFRRMIEPPAYSKPDGDFGFVHGELTGRTVGLLGCGHIGRRLLRFLRPFDCPVRVYDPYLPRAMADELDVLATSLDEVMGGSDVVISLVPLSPRTRGMIGARELGLLRPGAVFVNVSRGAVVDSDALVDRLRRGDVVASLDVFDPEPIPDGHPIKTLPNVFLSPHIAGVTLASRTRFFALMVEELARFFGGHDTRYDLDAPTLANRRGA